MKVRDTYGAGFWKVERDFRGRRCRSIPLSRVNSSFPGRWRADEATVNNIIVLKSNVYALQRQLDAVNDIISQLH